MPVRNQHETCGQSYSARPKYAKKPKLRWRPHVRNRAREEFEIEGISNEIPIFDYSDNFDATEEPRPEDAIIARLEDEESNRQDQETQRDHRIELLKSAMDGLSDKARFAVYLYGCGLSQHEASEIMGNAQTSYREILVGKDGKGGAIKKLRDCFGVNPITLTREKG